MTLAKRRIAAAVAVIGVASLITFLQVEANHETEDQIGEEAVWNAGPEDLSAIGQACKMTDAARYRDCFIEQMGEYASSDAVAFTQMIASQKSRRLGYLAGLKESGLVDLGYVVYPDGSPRQGWALLNGVPALINLNDVTMLPKSAMEKDPQYAAMRQSHPKMQLVVNDAERKADASPQIEQQPGEKERFIVPYSLQDSSCGGCAPLAQAMFGFDFNEAGKFLGIKFLRIEKPQQ